MVKSFGLIANLLPQQHDDFRQIIATALFLENTKCVKMTLDDVTIADSHGWIENNIVFLSACGRVNGGGRVGGLL